MQTRVTDYTVPFGSFGGLGAQGFERSADAFAAAPQALLDQLAKAGQSSYSPVVVVDVEEVFCAAAVVPSSPCGTNAQGGRTLRHSIKAAALDSTNDKRINYDSLVFYDAAFGITAGPFVRPPAEATPRPRVARGPA